MGAGSIHYSFVSVAGRRDGAGGDGKPLFAQLSWMEAFRLGFALSPTDPVVTSSVAASARVPQVVRHMLNLEPDRLVQTEGHCLDARGGRLDRAARGRRPLAP